MLAYDPYAQVVVSAEAYEDAPALDAGIDRGARISAIGTSSGNMRSISSIVASQGTAGIIDALGPATAGGATGLGGTTAVGQMGRAARWGVWWETRLSTWGPGSIKEKQRERRER